jgi:hypothetical protein
MAEFYFQIMPYAYAANTPINAIDPDGNTVIFINGNHRDGTGGSSDYWRGSKVTSNGNGTKTYNFWSFDSYVMNKFNDHNVSLSGTTLNPYIDGSMGGNAPNNGNLNMDNRVEAGYKQGSLDTEVIIIV